MDKTIKGKWQQKESGGGNSNIRQAKTSDKKQEDTAMDNDKRYDPQRKR